MKIKDIKTDLSNVDVQGSIVLIMPTKTVNLRAGGTSTCADALLQDETGSIKLSLWGAQIDAVKQGDQVSIRNGYSVVRHGEPELNIGRYGKITVISDDDDSHAADTKCPFCHRVLSVDTVFWCENTGCVAYTGRFLGEHLEILFRSVLV